MKSGGYLSVAGYFALQVALFEIVVLSITALVCWWIGHWSPAGYSNGLSWAGGLVILFGIFSIIGGPQHASGNFKQGFGSPMKPQNLEPGQAQNLADSQLPAIIMILAGITTLVIGGIIKNFIA